MRLLRRRTEPVLEGMGLGRLAPLAAPPQRTEPERGGEQRHGGIQRRDGCENGHGVDSSHTVPCVPLGAGTDEMEGAAYPADAGPWAMHRPVRLLPCAPRPLSSGVSAVAIRGESTPRASGQENRRRL